MDLHATPVVHYHDGPMKIDGHTGEIRVRKMEITEWSRFQNGFARIKQKAARNTKKLKSETLADAEVDAALDREQANDDEATEWMVSVITTYISAKPGQFHDDDGTPLLTGRDFLLAYGARVDVIGALVAQIHLMHTLPAAAKKALRSALASAPGSPAPTSAANGDKPAPTATSAAPPTSALSADATAATANASSGLSAPSS